MTLSNLVEKSARVQGPALRKWGLRQIGATPKAESHTSNGGG